MLDDHLARLLALGHSSKRRSDLVIFIGRHEGHLIDNVKYLYLHAVVHDYGFESFFFTRQTAEYNALKNLGLPVCKMDQTAIKLLTTAGVIVIDDMPLSMIEPFYLGIGAKKLQLWHGIPLKKIGFPEIESAVNMTSDKAQRLAFAYSGFDVVASTSDWVTTTLFSEVFRAKKFIECGYPRNDVLCRPLRKFDLINADADRFSLLKQHKRSGGKIALYMPTFRDNGQDLLDEQGRSAIDLPALSRFALENNLLFVFKLHPYVDCQIDDSLPGLLSYRSDQDIYPVLPLADVLITDYSSVYFDYLLLDRPIIFFTYDPHRYTSTDRELFFDFKSMAPGPIALTQAELLIVLKAILSGQDDQHQQERQTLCNKLFKYHDSDAAARICAYIRDKMLPEFSD